MRAVVITRPGGPEVLEVRDVPTPEPAPDEVLVRVRATALNRADMLQREGRYPPPAGVPRDIPGLEFAGEVAAAGDRVTRWRPGDRVFGLVGGGAYAEFITAHERTITAIPSTLDWERAAAVPEAFITAHDALVTQARVALSERVLIHAVGSGVGLAAVQLVRSVGAIPYGTSRTSDKIDRAREYGLAEGVVLGTDLAPLATRVREWTGLGGVDVVLDLVGGPYTPASLAVLAPRGRLMLVGLVAGAQAQLDLRRILSQRLTIVGTVLRARPLEEKIAVTSAFASQVVPLLERGVLRPVVDTVFPLDDVAEAHRRMESNETTGKIVLSVS